MVGEVALLELHHRERIYNDPIDGERIYNEERIYNDPMNGERIYSDPMHMWHEMRPYSRIIIRETGPLAPFYIVDPCDQIQDFYPDQYSQISK